MKRRTFLGAGALGLAGVTGAIKNQGSNMKDNRPVGSDWDESMPYDSFETIDSFAIGEKTPEFNPCGMTIRNADTSPRPIEFQIYDTIRNKLLLDKSYELAGGERISGELRTYTDYEIHVSLSEKSSLGQSQHVESIQHSVYDTCNEYGDTITVWENGSITSNFTSTTEGCLDEISASIPTTREK